MGSKGTSGGGGGGGGDTTPPSPRRLPLVPPPTSLSREPSAISTSPPPLQPPRAPPRAADRDTEPLSDLILKSSNNYIIQEKIKILSKQYGLLRRTWSDGSCFYRALLFSYLENLGQMQDRQAEVFRLMQCVEVSTKRFYQLEWGEAYLLKPEFLSSLVFEFYCLVNSVANGLTSEKLYERSLEDPSSGTIMYFLRVLTEVEIRTQDIYRPFIPKDMDVVQYCRKKVRGVFPEAKVEALQFCRTKVCHQYAEAEAIQMRALTYALGIPLRVEIVDTKSMPGQAVRVKRLDFFNRSGLGKRPYHIVQSYYSSSTAHKPLERGSNDNLLSLDGTPLLTLLSRHGCCDILYPK
ncbi:hypothetical protein QYE76_038429 [Lolium multiflorum]|uniref:Ubiquitinyl hydrolase 1 n=1 Tax=Lolium multiflorum TaxID=4521 RepID=A0AAD8WSV8_LOLMU|nr:hypothetical protein QYE76_038429 [Lolium multiflorum]